MLADGRLAAVDDDRPTGAEAPGLADLALLGAPAVVHVGPETAAPQLRQQGQHARAVGSLAEDEVNVELVSVGRAVPDREQEPLDSGAEADRGRRVAADFLDQAVVAAAS